MFRDHVSHGVGLRRLFQVAPEPCTLLTVEEQIDLGVTLSQWPVVEIGRIVKVSGAAVGIQFDVEHPLGDDSPLAGAGRVAVL